MSKAYWLLSAGLAALATPAYAQPAPTDTTQPSPTQEAGSTEDQTGEEEIIVTSTRRNQALSDVPLAVSAVTGEQLEASGAADIRQLQQLSPSLLVTSTSSEAGASTARIRGIGTVGDNPGLESSVAVFIDGVYRSRNATALTELGAIDRIEVLRGPQGTLFGRNASAGIISIITQRPQFQFGVNGELSYGNYDFVRGELGVTGPLTQGLAFRLDGVYMRRDGFITDVISGRDINDRDRFLIRGQLLFEPTDALSIRLIGDYAERDEECCAAVYLPFQDYTLAGPQASTMAGILRGLGATITDDTFARLTSITAYRSNDFIRGMDADYNNLDILRRNSDGGSRQIFETFTQELRLQGEAFGGRLDWLVGGYFGQEDLYLQDNLSYGADYERFANCVLFASALPSVLQPTPTGNCVNRPVLSNTISALDAGIQQVQAGIISVQAGIAALSAIPPGNRTPAQAAQLAALQAQLPQLQAQLGGLQAQRAPLAALNANPARPGFGSLAAVFGQPNLPLSGTGTNDRYDLSSQSFAIFTHNIFEITPALHLTLGARYTNERRTLNADLRDNNLLCTLIGNSPLGALSQLPCVLPSLPGGSFQGSEEYEDDAISGTAVLSFRPIPQLLTYAGYSRGYKSGGFNLDRSALFRLNGVGGASGSGPIGPNPSLARLIFEPEEVDAFEIGAKYNGAGFDINVAAFYQVFDNFQLNAFNGLFFEVANINSCSESLGGADTDNSPVTGRCTGETRGGVESLGAEVEVFLRPRPDLAVNLGATVVDTRYRENLVGANGDPLSNAFFQLPGRRLSNSASGTFTASLGYRPAIGTRGYHALIYLDGRLQTRINTGSDLDIEKEQDTFFTSNARLGLVAPGGAFSIELWVQNMFDQDFTQISFDAPIQGSGTIRGVQAGFYPRATQLFGSFLGEPRTFGVTGRFRF
jgi:outer membrane receptor protein involved in Fe transport